MGGSSAPQINIPSMTVKSPEEQIQAIVKAYKKLGDIKSVAKKFNYAPNTIYRKLKRGNCKLQSYKRKSNSIYIPSIKKKEVKSYADYLAIDLERQKHSK